MFNPTKILIWSFAAIVSALIVPTLVYAQIQVVGGLSRRMEAAPGEEVQGRVVVRNASDTPRSARVYLTDYQAFSNGTTRYGDPAENGRSNAAWIHMVPREQEIPAKGSASFHYVISVPEDEALSGSYWSMLMVEPIAPEELAPPDPDGDKVRFGIRTRTRTGIHIATHIQDSGKRDLRFSGRELEKQKGNTALRLDLENTGERYLRLSVWAELFDSQGFSLGRFDAGTRGLYPGNSGRVRMDLAGVPPGEYEALVVADNGDEYVFGARYELEIPE